MKTLSISIEWQKINTDLSRCKLCDEVIYSDMYILVMKSDHNISKTHINICQSCHETINHEKET